MTKADVSITGPTTGFPYREGQGIFRASGHATGIDLFYAAGWPELRGVESDFSFDGPALHAVASRGSIGGVPFTNAEVNSGDLRDAVFAARGRTETDAGRAIRMLQGTPLAPSFGALFADLTGAGPVKAEIAMVLPIKELRPARRDRDGEPRRRDAPPPAAADRATDVTGDLWVRNREMQAPAISGRALGGRWQASIATTALANGNLRTRVDAQGSLQGSALQPLARLPVNAGLDRQQPTWRGSLDVERNVDPKLPARGTVAALERPARPRVGAAGALRQDRRTVASACARRELRRHERPAHRGLARARRPCPAAMAKPGAAQAPVERGIVAFGGDVPDALPKARRPLAHGPPRVGKPHEAARPQVG